MFYYSKIFHRTDSVFISILNQVCQGFAAVSTKQNRSSNVYLAFQIGNNSRRICISWSIQSSNIPSLFLLDEI